ncbi:DUF559 domain-containing protein [Chloroflexi bacterium CFX6]|nr:DUF559 domain-containing protein [Chloroflexi bacterium CFX6]
MFVRVRRQSARALIYAARERRRAGLVFASDGNIHDLQKGEDERREKVLSALGLRVVRFRNDEVVRDLSAVVGRIRGFVLCYNS